MTHARLGSTLKLSLASPACRSGKGGRGEITEKGGGKWVRNFKYRAGGNSPKKIFLQSATPANGTYGGSVV